MYSVCSGQVMVMVDDVQVMVEGGVEHVQVVVKAGLDNVQGMFKDGVDNVQGGLFMYRV